MGFDRPTPDGLVLLESRPDGVAVLRLNRPPLNPLSTALMVELADHALKLAADPEVKAVVVTGSAKAFAAGADVAEFTAEGAARRVSAGLRAGLDAVAEPSRHRPRGSEQVPTTNASCPPGGSPYALLPL